MREIGPANNTTRCSGLSLIEETCKVTKLVYIMTSALAMFKMSVSKSLNDGRVDEQEFTMLQTFHLGTLYELAIVDCKMETETRAQLQKAYWTRSMI